MPMRRSAAAAGDDHLGGTNDPVADAVALAHDRQDALVVELRARLVLKGLVLPGVVECAKRLNSLDAFRGDQVTQGTADTFDTRRPFGRAPLLGRFGQQPLKVVKDREQPNDEIDARLRGDVFPLLGYLALVGAEVEAQLAQ